MATPAFVLAGEHQELGHQFAPKKKGPQVGNLKAQQKNRYQFDIEFTPKQRQKKPLRVTAVLLGHGLESKVTSGENVGETLAHEFVVLGNTEVQLSQNAKSYHGKLQLPKSNMGNPKSLSFAIWVSEEGSLKPIQALGGKL